LTELLCLDDSSAALGLVLGGGLSEDDGADDDDPTKKGAIGRLSQQRERRTFPLGGT
jgi:hypothetical protein